MGITSGLTREQSNALYLEVMGDGDSVACRELCLTDLFFLISSVFNRGDIDRDWLYARVREVEAEPNGCLDLWAREHYKSTIITYGLTIQDILNDPELTVGLFSFKISIATAFLTQIKTELESNVLLKGLFPDILYGNPKSEAPSWSVQSGITVKRKRVSNMHTVEANGLVDSMPTSKHYKLLLYDDVVTEKSVYTPEQIMKTTDAFKLSSALGAEGGTRRMIGTRYHFSDTYGGLIKEGRVKVRMYPGTDDGTINGNPVLFSKEYNDNKKQDMGSYIYSCQILQDPIADNKMGFKRDWLKYWDNQSYEGFNLYLLVDPAGAKKRYSDYTVMVVIGLAPDGNYYLIDGIRDRLNLTERTAMLFKLYRKYHHSRQKVTVGYEKYGKDSDIEHIESKMDDLNYRFSIAELGGNIPKKDRIGKLVPNFEEGQFYIPKTLYFNDYQGNLRDFIKEFIEDEYIPWPVPVHDDMLDIMARIHDEKLDACFPLSDEYDMTPAKANELRAKFGPPGIGGAISNGGFTGALAG